MGFTHDPFRGILRSAISGVCCEEFHIYWTRLVGTCSESLQVRCAKCALCDLSGLAKVRQDVKDIKRSDLQSLHPLVEVKGASQENDLKT